MIGSLATMSAMRPRLTSSSGDEKPPAIGLRAGQLATVDVGLRQHRADWQISGRDDHRDASLFDFAHRDPLYRAVDGQRRQRGDGHGDGDDEEGAYALGS